MQYASNTRPCMHFHLILQKNNLNVYFDVLNPCIDVEFDVLYTPLHSLQANQGLNVVFTH